MQLERLYRHWIDDLWAGDYDWARKLVAEEFVGHQDGARVAIVGNDILRSDGEKFVEYWVGSMMVP